MRNSSKIAISIVLLLVFASAANAGIIGSIDIGNVSNDLSDQATITGAGYLAFPVYTGVYTFNNLSNASGAGVGVPDFGFCIELPQGTGINLPITYDVRDLQDAPLPPNYGTPMGMPKADLIRELWDKYFDPAWVTGASTVAEKQMAEAFGVAIWEIVYETDATLDVTTGPGFSATGVEQAILANQWLDDVVANNLTKADVIALSNIDHQDFVTVPEPMTMALLALGGLGIFRRKR
ncbi:MAG: PEP-CTERM sorting domain-containing protein [Anaerohalosphaera sp.]|nr:PEP-CTERM sorting domain-containing protein [Anaerohalosphaera sp.]